MYVRVSLGLSSCSCYPSTWLICPQGDHPLFVREVIIMPKALQPGFHCDLILASPHRVSLDAFVNPGSPQASGLHALLTDCGEGDAASDCLPIVGQEAVNIHQ